jgi:PPOX class probable FMN-dependent enzyme
MDPHAVDSVEKLAALYAPPHPRFIKKVADRLEDRSRAFIAAAPFCILATRGHGGAHASPRGDGPGFCVPLDDWTLAMPDRRGNNRLDALHDILQVPEVALLFLIPGVGETLRVNGSARITADPKLLARFVFEDKLPTTVVMVAVREVYAHCAKSIIRSKLWGEGVPRPTFVPTNGELIAAATKGEAIDAVAYEAAYQQRLKDELY